MVVSKPSTDALQSMEHPLTQECEACSAIAHPLDEFEFIDFALSQAKWNRRRKGEQAQAD
jgi:hypothetical protein